MAPRDITNPSREAKAFLLWREGQAVDWDCSISELAEAAGVPRRTASHIAEERGWKLQDGRGAARLYGLAPVDEYMTGRLA